MFMPASLVILSLTLPSPIDPPGRASALSLGDGLAAASPWSMELSLHTPRFFAQSQAPTAAAPADDASGGSTSSEACDVDCEEAREARRTARYVMRNRERTLRTHRAFAIAAWSTLLVTEALGTIQAINQDTWFGRGNCASDPRAFACEQYSLVQSLHETFAIAGTALYVTAGALAIAAPDPENAAVGEGRAESRLRLHKVLGFVHGAGMILLPLLGILSVHPEIFGINDNAARADFTRATRTVHVALGYATFATLTFAGALELF